MCVLAHCMDARLGCYEGSQVCWSRDVTRPFVPDSGLACAECCLRQASMKPRKRRLRERCPTRFSYRIVWPCTRKMWLMRLTPALSPQECRFCLRVLAELNAFMHCSNDIPLGQELIRDVLSRSVSHSKCYATLGDCDDFGHLLHVDHSGGTASQSFSL